MKVKTKATQVKGINGTSCVTASFVLNSYGKICMEKHSNTSQESKPQWNKCLGFVPQGTGRLLATCFRNPRSNLSISRLKPG
jgi:hypothetical protein